MKCLHIRVHPTHPQKRLVQQAAEILGRDGVLVCPTDASYSLICRVGSKAAEDRMYGEAVKAGFVDPVPSKRSQGQTIESAQLDIASPAK